MIHIYGEWYADADERQYTLVRRATGNRKNKDTGEKEETTVNIDAGYYPTMGALVREVLRKVARQKVQSGEIKTLKDWLEEYERTRKSVLDGVEE